MTFQASVWVNTTQGIASLVQAAGIVVAGVWAYFKFVRVRPYVTRAELTLRASLLDLDSHLAVKADVTLRNAGAARITLGDKYIWVNGLRLDNWEPGIADWGEELSETPIFENDEWVEGEETISAEVLVPLPVDRSESPVVYLVVAGVGTVGGDVQSWYAQTILTTKRAAGPTETATATQPSSAPSRRRDDRQTDSAP